MFGTGAKKVKKVKKVKKKPSMGQGIEIDNPLPGNDHDLVNQALVQRDISPLNAREVKPIASNTIDHPGRDNENKVLQPQDEQSIPDLDFDPNDPGQNNGSNANDSSIRPSGMSNGMSKQDSDAINGDVEGDDDFDYDDIDIQDNNSPKSR